MALQSIRTQLKIVACLPRHGRLAVGRAGFAIEREVPLLASAARWVRGDGRLTMLHALEELLAAVAEKAGDMAGSRHLVDMHSDKAQEAAVRANLGDLAADLAAAADGFKVLLETYAQDHAVCARLEVMAHRAAHLVHRMQGVA